MKSRTWICTTALCLFAALVIPPRLAALNDPNHQPTIITFEVPGAGTGPGAGTFPVAINPEGAITGYYIDANGFSHGFLRAPDGTFTTFDVVGDVDGIIVSGINPEGAITGSYLDSNLVIHGFLRAPDGSITLIDVPGAGNGAGTFQGTTSLNINAAGEIVGSYLDANNINHGFLRACHRRDDENDCDNGKATLTTFDVPGAGTGPFEGTTVYGIGFFGGNSFGAGINPGGAIAGTYFDSNFLFHAFLRAPDGDITPFDVPGASTTRGVTDASAINPHGAITGFYFQPIAGNPFGGNYRGFLRDRDGTFTTFDAATYSPCCIWTFPEAINPDGVITGYDNDGHDINHGFLRARDGTITTFDAPGAGTGHFQGTIPFSINPKGAITGYYIDANRLAHGFLRKSGCDLDDNEQECK